MENEIEQLIRLDKLGLEKQVDLDPFLPQRLRSRLQARRRPAKRLAWASAFCLIVALLTLIHLQWLPSPAPKPLAGQPALQLLLFPAELQNTIYHSFFEVAKWEK